MGSCGRGCNESWDVRCCCEPGYYSFERKSHGYTIKNTNKQFNNCKVFEDFKIMITETKSTLVDIIVPPQFHLNFIKIAAESNVNIICQKPFTNSIKEAKEA